MLLELEQVTASYAGFRALHDIDLTVAAGRAVGVVGGNGAGKSTLASVIVGLKRHDGGQVRFGGAQAPRRAHRRARAGIGYVPERRQLFGDLTVRENLLVPLRGDRTAKQRVDELVDWFPWMGERLDDQAGLLSGGQQTMVAVARALAHRPQLLVIEEPSKSLSPNTVAAVRDQLLSVRREGLALVVFEQQIHRLRELVDDLCILVRGRIEARGAADDESLEGVLSTSIIGGGRTVAPA